MQVAALLAALPAVLFQLSAKIIRVVLLRPIRSTSEGLLCSLSFLTPSLKLPLIKACNTAHIRLLWTFSCNTVSDYGLNYSDHTFTSGVISFDSQGLSL